MKLVVFDMGHVFIKFNWQTVCDGFAERAKIPRESFGETLKYLGNLGYEKGEISTDEFLRQLNSMLNLRLDLTEFTHLWNATFEEDREMSDLMEKLGKTIPLYLLSNTNENHYDYLQNRFNVARHFRELILSYKVGYAKPESKIYGEIFKRSGLQPSDCLLIDDLKVNIEAANNLGMKTILYTDTADLKEKLPSFGVKL